MNTVKWNISLLVDKIFFIKIQDVNEVKLPQNRKNYNNFSGAAKYFLKQISVTIMSIKSPL